MSAERGQATVELVALLPLVAVVVSTVLCVLAAGRAREVSAVAAQAGAMAVLQDADAARAARAVVPAADRLNTSVLVSGRRVTVRVEPRLPVAGLADRLAATSTADAGPARGPGS